MYNSYLKLMEEKVKKLEAENIELKDQIVTLKKVIESNKVSFHRY